MHQIGTTHVIVGGITVSLQDPVELSQKLFWSIPSSTHTEVKDHGSSRSTVLPQVSLMMFFSTVLHLHRHGSFVGLDVTAAEYLAPHRTAHRDQQFANREYPTIQGRPAKF